MYTEMTDHNTLPSQIAEQRKIIDNANKKKSKLLQLSVDGMIADIDFKHMTAQSNKEIEEAERQIQERNSQLETSDEFRKKIDAIKKTLAAAQRDAAQEIISKEFVERYIDKILVTPEEDGSMTLNIRIFTGETTKKSLQEIRRRTGHTFLPMYYSSTYSALAHQIAVPAVLPRLPGGLGKLRVRHGIKALCKVGQQRLRARHLVAPGIPPACGYRANSSTRGA